MSSASWSSSSFAITSPISSPIRGGVRLSKDASPEFLQASRRLDGGRRSRPRNTCHPCRPCRHKPSSMVPVAPDRGWGPAQYSLGEVMDKPSEQFDAVVVGAGFAGLYMLHR